MEKIFRGFSPDKDGQSEIFIDGKKIKGFWVYGDLLFGTMICQKPNDKKIEKEDFESIIINLFGLKTFYVYPETVGHYAGVKDDDGIEMFEGDIVSGALHWLGKPINGVVSFKDGSFGVSWRKGSVNQFNAFTSMRNVKYKIIGNVYERKLEEEGFE